MPRTFEVTVLRDLEAGLAQLREVLAEFDIVLHGDTRSGKIDGPLKGSYRMTGTTLSVTIIEKPDIFTWDDIEAFLKEQVLS